MKTIVWHERGLIFARMMHSETCGAPRRSSQGTAERPRPTPSAGVLATHALIVLPAPAAFRFHPARADAGCRVSTSSHEAPRAGAGCAASASSCRPGRPLGHRGLGRDRLAGRSIRRPRGSALGLLLLFLLAHDWRVAEGKQVGIQVGSQDLSQKRATEGISYHVHGQHNHWHTRLGGGKGTRAQG